MVTSILHVPTWADLVPHEFANGDQSASLLTLQHSKTFTGFAPTKTLAESWVNVGLLIEPSRPKVVRRIGLCNDLTTEVMNEMVEAKADLIVSYHPPIFRPLKKITFGNWKVRSETLGRLLFDFPTRWS